MNNDVGEGGNDISLLVEGIMPLILVIVPALISYIVATQQVKETEKNLNKQIDAEIEKVKLQYKFEQKRDNNNFLIKVRIEEAKELVSSIFYLRDNVQIYGAYMARGNRTSPIYKEFIEKFQQEVNNATVYANYFPNLKNEILDNLNRITDALAPLSLLVAEERSLEEDTFDNIGKKTLDVSLEFSDIARKIANKVEKQIQTLEEVKD